MISGGECLLLFTMSLAGRAGPSATHCVLLAALLCCPVSLGPIFVPKAPNSPLPTDRSHMIDNPDTAQQSCSRIEVKST